MESTTCTTPHLLKVAEALVLPAHDGRHPPERRALQLLAPVQRVAELEEPDVVLGDGVDEVPRGVDLAQRQLVVVLGVRSGSGGKGVSLGSSGATCGLNFPRIW